MLALSTCVGGGSQYSIATFMSSVATRAFIRYRIANIGR
ncbi:hypothetical protein CEV32_4257 [Brucella rhizosphaerae]|uniref:Uncharacterized protein n=1 Tax=Brucella rhizosphaerae TaxID=571254 RepID=A0A256FP39_9HYPH|nr:hypothetical protein CEV32_4257 [Brucella rhizosphaerae]